MKSALWWALYLTIRKSKIFKLISQLSIRVLVGLSPIFIKVSGITNQVLRKFLLLLVRFSGLPKSHVFVPQFRISGYSQSITLLEHARALKKIVVSILSIFIDVLSPQVFLKQLSVFFLLMMVRSIAQHIKSILYRLSNKGNQIHQLKLQMKNAESYEKYSQYAKELELIEGGSKKIDFSNLDRLKEKSALYANLIMSGNSEELQSHLRNELSRKHWGLGRADSDILDIPVVKDALEWHMDVISAALGLIAGSHEITNSFSKYFGSIPTLLNARSSQQQLRGEKLSVSKTIQEKKDDMAELKRKLAFFEETRHSFGRSALLLSGGATMGIQHGGVVKTLHDLNLLPRIISGTSAGSVVAAFLGCMHEDELQRMLDENSFPSTFFGWIDKKGDFDSHKLSDRLFRLLSRFFPLTILTYLRNFFRVIRRVLQKKSIVDYEILKESIRAKIGDMTFEEAYEKTGRILNITVTAQDGTDWPRLLNYLSAPNVVIWSAAVASCAVPIIFPSAELFIKDTNGKLKSFSHNSMKWTDGSIESDLPMQQLAELFNVNHFIVSQVNAHGYFLAGESKKDPISVFMAFLKTQLVNSTIGLTQLLLAITSVGSGFLPLITQKYEGDITILTDFRLSDLPALIRNPSVEESLKMVERGQKNTWPHIDRIRLHCMTEFMLDDCVIALRKKIGKYQSPSERKLNSKLPSFLQLNSLDVPDQDDDNIKEVSLHVRSIHGIETLFKEQSLHNSQ